jgi:hypothetical protein
MGRSIFGSGTTSASGSTISMFSAPPRAKTIYVTVQVIDPDYDLSANTVIALKQINTDYVARLATRQFASITTSLNEALILYDQIYQLQQTRKSEIVITLLQLTMNGLQGAMNVYVLYTRNIELQMSNTILEKKIETILSGKNDITAMTNGSGQIDIVKTFKLAPLYSYYIMMYGMPAFGVGFDLEKLSIIQKVLIENGIDPMGG